MTARCFFLRRRFVLYLEGELPPDARERIRSHLVRCRDCRELFARVQAGHDAGREFGRTGQDIRERPPEFEELRARTGGLTGRRGLHQATWRRLPALLAARPAVQILVVFSLALSVLLVLANRKTPGGVDGRALFSANAPRGPGYTPLTIAAFEPNTKSPVVTEGLVRGVYFDEQEKTLHIKLVEPGEKAEPFVICEVRSPGRMAIPQEGNRVRVYGMARFDPQPGRGWNEVNPVTNIDILKR
jgi:hypothetical protein